MFKYFSFTYLSDGHSPAAFFCFAFSRKCIVRQQEPFSGNKQEKQEKGAHASKAEHVSDTFIYKGLIKRAY